MSEKGMIYVDISHVIGTINMMKSVMAPASFNKMLQRTFDDAGAKVKTFVRQEVPKDYAVTASWAGSFVKKPQRNGASIGVTVPIMGARGRIGEVFGASGGSYTRKGYTRKDGRRVKRTHINKTIRAKIVKGKTSELPKTMEHQGGQPPFRHGGAVFTRKYKGRAYPVVHVVALGDPQMPANRTKEKLEKDIQKTVETRLVHHFGRLFGQ